MPEKIRVYIVGAAAKVFARRAYEAEARPGMRLRDLLIELAAGAGPGFGGAVYDLATGTMNEHVAVFVNAREARSLQGLDTALEPGDLVTIMPPMAGGSSDAWRMGVVEKVDARDDGRFKI